MDKSVNFNNLIRPCNNHEQTRHINPTLKNLHSSHSPEKEVRIIPGPAGIVQLAKRRKQADISEGRQERVISTQEYIRTVLEDMEVDEVFSRGPWLSAVDFLNANEEVVYGCLGDIKSFIDNGKVAQVVAIIKSCSPNALGDLTVTLKDLSGSIPGAIHHKIINEEGGYGKDIHVGAAVIVHNVSVFSPNRHTIHSIILTLQRKT
ncbi:hypothetical protein CTI12_AA513310 [Artemisia annua]|uniref:Homologous recombination OB-fold protein OB-fold domain-containing protein n=1 Tax=Artemisia annua TaxID=35608 RepID=A0A2U1LA80_ARTAN|nr:hypothetical protein CTI12_AA513310 [Artemisia annua]